MLLAVAGMTQRWRQQTQSMILLVRNARAQIMAEAARREAARRRQEREKKPFASAARSRLYFLEVAAQHSALAWTARAAGDDATAARHQAEADWNVQEACQCAAFAAIFPEV
jgi:hypothetical protein